MPALRLSAGKQSGSVASASLECGETERRAGRVLRLSAEKGSGSGLGASLESEETERERGCFLLTSVSFSVSSEEDRQQC